jgi:predicted MFS family arabinose efflux permease
MLSLAFVQDPISAGGIYIVRAALMNMSAPLSDSYLMRIISSQERGFASAINSIIWRLPNGVSTIVGGLILESGSFDLPFLLATGFYAVSTFIFYQTFRKVNPQA